MSKDEKDLERASRLDWYRIAALKRAKDRLKAEGVVAEPEQAFLLASTDLFVEKAQIALTRRAHYLFLSGAATTLVIVGILAKTAIFIAQRIAEPMDPAIYNSTRALGFRVFQSTALTAVSLIGIKFLLSLARSFFHEGQRLFELRHALRFGRLFVYLRHGTINDNRLEDAFQWNKESRTSFLDMRPEMIADTVFNKLVDSIGKLPPDTLKMLTELMGDYLQENRPKKRAKRRILKFWE